VTDIEDHARGVKSKNNERKRSAKVTAVSKGQRAIREDIELNSTAKTPIGCTVKSEFSMGMTLNYWESGRKVEVRVTCLVNIVKDVTLWLGKTQATETGNGRTRRI